jgi:hypothetical protein
MLKIFYYLFFLLTCTSCANYQYSTVVSDTPKKPDGIHLFENDSVQIKYSFKGQDCPLDISIFNKLSVPLFVDWKKSSVIINQQRFPLWIDQSEINANTQGSTTVQWTNLITHSSSTTGTMIRSESVSFIPPQSYVTMKPILLQQDFFKLDRKNSTKTILQSPATKVLGYEYSFQREDSPLAFRSFLVLSSDEKFPSPLYLEHRFWVSHVLETALLPRHKPLSGNQFLTKKLQW